MNNPLLDTIQGNVGKVPPIWFMRQAGRYLPEYRELRSKASNFMQFCFNPEMATIATLQPISRFDLDAAILFSDILVVPAFLGVDVNFIEGTGPVMKPVENEHDIKQLENIEPDRKLMEKVFSAVSMVRSDLANNKALIGFCGAPWTVATYMVAGQGGDGQVAARQMAYQAPELFGRLIDLLTGVSITYLKGQLNAGADVIKIFDSWAGVLPTEELERWCIRPLSRIIKAIKKASNRPIIVFAKGANSQFANLVESICADAYALDWTMDLEFARKSANGKPLQGNMDPLLLLNGGESMISQADRICSTLRGTPHIFNLGHGVLPSTPIDNVKLLVDSLR